jgi:RHS repeat-associated protein
VKETSLASSVVQRTTNYVHPLAYPGLLYEEDALAGGVTRQRAYLGVQGATIGVVTKTGSTQQATYWLKDQLGSIDVVADGAGNVLEHLDYEPFGKRRNNGATDPNGTLASSSTNRGFTGQEELDEVGLVHMNGRVYDPSIGRFVSPDPTIPHPANPQSYNRFAYVMNNPLSLTDPTGYADSGDGGDGEADKGDTSGNVGQLAATPVTQDGGRVGLSSPNANAGPVDDKNGQTQVNTDSTTDAKFSPEERAEYDGGYKQDFQTTSAEAKTAKTIGRALDNASDVPKEVAPAVKAGLWEAFKLWLTDGASRILSSGKVIKEIPLLRKVAPAAKDAQAGAADGKIAAQFERQNVNITGHRAAEATESSGIGSFSSRCASCCFSGDTPILAEGGLVRIDQLHVGDRVEARDEKTGRTALKRVANVIVSQNRELYGLTLLEEHGRVTRVEVTDNHPFWVTGRGWVQSIDLKRGMKLVNFDHQLVTVVNLDDLGRKATTYNLTVEGYHTFFAGESLALVHNAGGCCGAKAVTSRIKESPRLAREADAAGKSHQQSLDRLVDQLRSGNTNPGIGSKPIGSGLSEARARDGARVYFRETESGIEILGKSSKSNQETVIKEVLRVFGN